jgi:hypothetical protein
MDYKRYRYVEIPGPDTAGHERTYLIVDTVEDRALGTAVKWKGSAGPVWYSCAIGSDKAVAHTTRRAAVRYLATGRFA